MVGIALQEAPRYEYGARVIAPREEILRLFRQMVLAPGAISAVTAERERGDQQAGRETARPAPIKIAALKRADVAEAVVVISGILHCVEE